MAQFLKWCTAGLQIFDLSGSHVTDWALSGSRFSTCIDTLQCLDLSGTAMTASAVRSVLHSFTGLRQLHLSHCTDLTCAAALTNAIEKPASDVLDSLHMAHLPQSCELDTAFFTALQSNPSLTDVDLSGCNGVTDDVL